MESKALQELTEWLTDNSCGVWEYEAKTVDGEFQAWLIYFSDKLFFEDARLDEGHQAAVVVLAYLKKAFQVA